MSVRLLKKPLTALKSNAFEWATASFTLWILGIAAICIAMRSQCPTFALSLSLHDEGRSKRAV
eukprot:6172022-Pleurochrysis_carterae.AAC.1